MSVVSETLRSRGIPETDIIVVCNRVFEEAKRLRRNGSDSETAHFVAAKKIADVNIYRELIAAQ